MSTQSVVPNTSTAVGYGSVTGAATAHQALADSSDTTYISHDDGIYSTYCLISASGGTAVPATGLFSRERLRVRSRRRAGGTAWPLSISGYNEHVPMYLDPAYTTSPTSTSWQEGYSPWTTTNGAQVLIEMKRCDVSMVWWEVEYFLYGESYNVPGSIGPTGTVNNTQTPTITWTHNAETTQSKRRVKIFTNAVYTGGGFNVETSQSVFDSTATTSTNSVTTTTLTNGVTYWVFVKTAITVNGVDGWTGWSTPVSFSIAVDTGVPTDVTPAQGSTVATAKPPLNAGGYTTISSKRQWQIASNSTFTTNAQTIDEGVFRNNHSTAGAYAFPSGATPLTQGTWYIRSRFVDIYAVTGSWSNYNSFTVAHVPTATVVTPNGGNSYQYTGTSVQLDWSFSDPYADDAQTAYQIELWKASNKVGTVIDTGKVTSANTIATVGTFDATWKNVELRWRVKVWDVNDVASAWSTETAFYLRDLPVVAITSPTEGGTVSTPQPTITWTYSGTGTQAAYRVLITNLSAGGATVVDSGTLSGANLSWQIPSPLIQLSTNYRVTVYLTDSVGLVGSEFNAFTGSYTAPTTPTVVIDSSSFNDLSRIDLDWSSSTVDGANEGWRVYRRILGEANWRLVYDGSTAPSVKSYSDYLAESNQEIQYAVVQVNDDGFGGLAESAYSPKDVDLTGLGGTYWLIVPDQPSLNFALYHVTADDFGDEQEMAITNVVGRGRRVEYGTRFGQAGSLSAELRDNDEMDARQQRLWVEAIRDSGEDVYLRSPFGDIWRVAMPSATFSRVPGLGLRAHTTLSLEYSEITA